MINGQIEVKGLCDAVKIKLTELAERSNETGIDGIVDTALMIDAVEWISGLSDGAIYELQNYRTKYVSWEMWLYNGRK